MSFKKHDINSLGFNVDPDLLSHDLTLIKMQLSKKFKHDMNDTLLYELYLEELNSITAIVDDRIRYDSLIKK